MGIMLVYDITNSKSFDNIAKWLRNIDEVNDFAPIDNCVNVCTTHPSVVVCLFAGVTFLACQRRRREDDSR